MFRYGTRIEELLDIAQTANVDVDIVEFESSIADTVILLSHGTSNRCGNFRRCVRGCDNHPIGASCQVGAIVEPAAEGSEPYRNRRLPRLHSTTEKNGRPWSPVIPDGSRQLPEKPTAAQEFLDKMPGSRHTVQ